MTQLVLNFEENDFHLLENIANRSGKSAQELIIAWVNNLLKNNDLYDVIQDPICQIRGFESDSPADLSKNIDNYIYP